MHKNFAESKQVRKMKKVQMSPSDLEDQSQKVGEEKVSNLAKVLEQKHIESKWSGLTIRASEAAVRVHTESVLFSWKNNKY